MFRSGCCFPQTSEVSQSTSPNMRQNRMGNQIPSSLIFRERFQLILPKDGSYRNVWDTRRLRRSYSREFWTIEFRQGHLPQKNTGTTHRNLKSFYVSPSRLASTIEGPIEKKNWQTEVVFFCFKYHEEERIRKGTDQTDMLLLVSPSMGHSIVSRRNLLSMNTTIHVDVSGTAEIVIGIMFLVVI